MLSISTIQAKFGKVYTGQASIAKLQAKLVQDKLEKDIDKNVNLAQEKGINYQRPQIDIVSIENHIKSQAPEINETYNQLLKHTFKLNDDEVKAFNEQNPEYASVYFHQTQNGKVDINAERQMYTLTQEDMQALKEFIQQRLQTSTEKNAKS